MDPLSAAASILAILQVTSKVVAVCYDYRAAAKDSSWELPRVIEEIKSLRNVLETLEKLTYEMESPDANARARLPTLQILCKPRTGNEGGLLDMCFEELNKLKESLTPPKWWGPAGSKRRAVGHVLRWPLNKSDTIKMLETIGRFRDMLTLALTADQTTLVLKIEESVQAIRDSTTTVHEELGKLNASFKVKEIDEHLKRIHSWLEAPDPSANHVIAIAKRELTTGSWFIGGADFQKWKTTENSFLWLYGIPGCGKTILSSTIIQAVHEHCNLNRHLERRPSVAPIWAVAYFYFDFSDILKTNHNKMIRSLIKQLSLQLHYTSDALESLFTISTSGTGQAPSIEALRSTLSQMIQEFDQVYIILDALDECKQRELLLESIDEFLSWNHSELHILATSREENEIANEMNNLITSEQKVNIHKLFIDADIRVYIYARLQTDRHLKKWQRDAKVQATIATSLTEKADGMFRWAACQLDELTKCFSRRDLQVALASLPKTMDDTYAQILCSIDEASSDNVLKILQWLAYSARPLHIEEVADVIAVNVSSRPRIDIDSRFLDPRDILTICSSLVTTNMDSASPLIRRTVGEQIRLAHLSVKDYLTSKRILNGKAAQYGIQETRSHKSIAKICLAYLLQFDGSVLSEYSEDSEHYFPLATYAAEFWAYHVRASEESDEIVALIMELLTDPEAFSNWIQLFDSDKASPEVQMAGKEPESPPGPLYYASQLGLKRPVKLLLEQAPASIHLEGVYGSPLIAASAAGFHDTVKILLSHVSCLEPPQGGVHHNALQAACIEGHSEVVKVLIDAGINVNIEGGIYQNALQAASSGGFENIVKQIIIAGAEVNAYGGQYSSALIAASYAGHVKIVEKLLENGAKIDLPDKRGRTALAHASSRGQTATVKFLLSKGANVDAADEDGWAPIDEASPGGHYDSAKALLDAGAAINTPDSLGNTVLHFTASQPHTSVVKLLLERGANPNCANDFGETPLYGAASGGRYANVQALIESGAEVNVACANDWSSLHAAVAGGHEKVVILLLDNSAEFTPDADGWTPLHVAVLKGNENMVQLLLERRAALSVQDNPGLTPLDWASLQKVYLSYLEHRLREKVKGYFTVTGLRIASMLGEDVRIRQLLKSGADIDAKDDGGFAAIQWAAMKGRRSTMLLLIKNGADVNTRNQAGETIMNCIENWRDDTILELVQKKYDYQILEDEKLALKQKRQRVLELLTKWGEELPEYTWDAETSPVYADQEKSLREKRDEAEKFTTSDVNQGESSREKKEAGEASAVI